MERKVLLTPMSRTKAKTTDLATRKAHVPIRPEVVMLAHDAG